MIQGVLDTTDSNADLDSGGHLAFQTKGADGGTLGERMRITSAGNVGIGTTGPASKLEIRSASVATNNDAPNLFITASDSQAADLGGTLGFGIIVSDTNLRNLAQVSGRKDDGTAGNAGGYLTFDTSNDA